MRTRLPLVLAALAILVAGCAERREEPSSPRSYRDVEAMRIDLQPLSERVRQAMEAGDRRAQPEGAITQVISLDKESYAPTDDVWMTVVWSNNTDVPQRVCRTFFLGANLEILIILNDDVRVLPNVNPARPVETLRPSAFVVVPPFGECHEVINLKDLPRTGLAKGQNVKWGYDLSRPGRYWLRISMRSVPYQLVPELLLGDPAARKWEGSTLSNVVEFRVRRR